MTDKERAIRIFDERRKLAALRFGLLHNALKYRGMGGMKREIVRQTRESTPSTV